MKSDAILFSPAIQSQYEHTERGYLTMEELTILMQKAMPSKRLEQIRDVFVFSCFTGLAYCDARALTREHIITCSNNRPWLRTHRQKTSAPVDVPLLDVPLQILAKYGRAKKLAKKDVIN